MPQPPKNTRDFSSLIEVVSALRGPDGCPWDKEQTHESLTKYVIEEAHELAEAIDKSSAEETLDELGDVLFQVVLHSEIARQNNSFTIEDVIENLNNKMIRRHPHVFSDQILKNSDAVVENWDKIKASEKKKQPTDRFDIPSGLSPLLRSEKIGKKTKKYNFDWPDTNGVLAKVDEELNELKEAILQLGIEEKEHELGDLLFSIAQLARHLKIDSEKALRKANLRFEKRFFNMLKVKSITLNELSQMSEAELESLWQESKKDLKEKA